MRAAPRRFQVSGAAIACAAAALAAPASGSPAKLDPRTAAPSFVAGEVVVAFHPGVSSRERAALHAVRGARLAGRVGGLRVDVVRLPRGTSAPAAAAAYAASPLVVRAEPNYVRRLHGAEPLDALFQDLWGLDNDAQIHALADPPPATYRGSVDADVDAVEAWNVETGATSRPVVAVVDSGVDVTHADLAANVWTNAAEAGGLEGVDDDGNGYVDDVNGWDFGDGDADPSPAPPSLYGYEHGTHVAGTIAAARDEVSGVVGVCPDCLVMPLKVMDSRGEITLVAILRAFAYAKAMDVPIVNASFGASEWSDLERRAIGSGGFLLVASAGNGSADNDMLLDTNRDGVADSPMFPASYALPNVLSVAASNHRDEYGYSTSCYLSGYTRSQCAFSNWGHDSVDLAAPGVDVKSTVPGGWETFSGTSMAAPHAAGAAGLVLSRHPAYTPVQLKNALMASVDRPLRLTYLHSTLFRWMVRGAATRTSGRLNAAAALDADPNVNQTPRTDGNVDGARLLRRQRYNSVRWPDDVNDVYRRYLKRGATYRLVLDGPYGEDFDLIVWKPGTREIWQLTAACPYRVACRLFRYAGGRTADEVLRFKVRRPGVYYFQVSAWLRSEGSYRLAIRRTS